MPIVATAGHVDHGKSTLIEALTGRDPDRWAEEKERGLTIDLGFAWAQIDGIDVGFVDVPGHERFVKNMLAGMGAVDVALFVVAADEGWMPQTEEHLAILDLLDTGHGVIALTRTDLAEGDSVDVVELEILEQIEGTALADWPIVRVSAVAGEGLLDLRNAVADQLRAAGTPLDRGAPRLWIDRSFHISGAGTVVTGTLAGGRLTLDSDLMLWPGRTPVRIRGMQHHETPVMSLEPGARAALNITGADGAERGMLLGLRDRHTETTGFLGSLRQVRSLDGELTGRGAYHLHVGSGSWPVQLRLLEPTLGLIRSRQPVPVQFGDRFILRETGRRAVVAGGRVLDPRASGTARAMRATAHLLRSSLDADPGDVADALLSTRGTAALDELARDSGGGRPSTPYATATTAMAEEEAGRLLRVAVETVGSFHRENRLRSGLPKAELATTLGVTPETISVLVAGSADLIDEGPTVRRGDFAPGLSPSEEEAWQGAQRSLREGLAVPRASQLGLDTELLHALIRDGQLVRVAADLVYLPGQIEEIRRAMDGLDGEFTVAQFRDLIGVTRRQAVPLLEWFDQTGFTRRRGDTRSLRSGPAPT